MTNNQEIITMIVLTVSPLLFMLGGYRNKIWRRVVLSVVMAGSAIIWGIPIVLAVIFGVLSVGVLSLGYGTDTPWIVPFKMVDGAFKSSKILTACALSVPTATSIAFTIWQVILPPVFLILFWLSSMSQFRRDFQWKVVEGAIGFLYGATFISALYNAGE